MHGQGDGTGLRVKGILLRLLALELFGYCRTVISAIDVVVGNVKKIASLCLYII